MQPLNRYARAALGVALLLAPLASLTAQKARACWIVTPAEAAQILGKPELANGDVMHDNDQTCSYFRAGFDVHIDHVRTAAKERELLREAIKSNKVEAVTGVGDEAGFNKTDKNPSLVVISGSHVLDLDIIASSWKGSPEQIRPTLVKLAQAALPKLLATGTTHTSRACWLITPAELAEILGTPELKNGVAIRDDYDDCDYTPAGFDLDIIGYARVAPRSEGFKNLVKKGNAEAVPGIGDEAIFGHDASNHPTINVLLGSRELMITLRDETQGARPDAKPRLVQLAKTAAARLR
jgi:hypothetical protein